MVGMTAESHRSRMEQSSNRMRIEKAQRAMLQLFATCLVDGFHGQFTLTVNVKDGIALGHTKAIEERCMD